MPSPSRRSVLASLGALASLSVAGCLDNDSAGSETTSTSAEPSSTTTATSRNTTRTTRETTVSPDDLGTPAPQVGIESDEEHPVAAVAVGSRKNVDDPRDHRPHPIWIWNDSNGERRISYEIRRGDVVVKSGSSTLPADAYLTVLVLEPASYTLELAAGDSTETIEIPPDWIDCNESGTGVTVRGDGSIETMTFSTEVLCSTSTPETTS